MWMLEIFSLNQNEMDMFFFTRFTQVRGREAIFALEDWFTLFLRVSIHSVFSSPSPKLRQKNPGRRCIKDRLTWSHKIPLYSDLWSRSSLLLCCSNITESICQWTTKNYCSRRHTANFYDAVSEGLDCDFNPKGPPPKKVHQMDRIKQRNRHFSLVTVVPDIFRRKRRLIISTL